MSGGEGFQFKTNPFRVSSNPGYAFGRGGNVPANAWLNSEGIPSNKTGIPFGLANGSLEGIWVGNEDLSTFDIEIFQHLGDEIALTFLKSETVTASRNEIFIITGVAITKDVQLAVRITNGSAKNIKVYLDIKGDKI